MKDTERFVTHLTLLLCSTRKILLEMPLTYGRTTNGDVKALEYCRYLNHGGGSCGRTCNSELNSEGSCCPLAL